MCDPIDLEIIGMDGLALRAVRTHWTLIDLQPSNPVSEAYIEEIFSRISNTAAIDVEFESGMIPIESTFTVRTKITNYWGEIMYVNWTDIATPERPRPSVRHMGEDPMTTRAWVTTQLYYFIELAGCTLPGLTLQQTVGYSYTDLVVEFF